LIALYYNEPMKVGVVMQDGMPMLVITDEAVVDYEKFVEDAVLRQRQVGKSALQQSTLEAFLRCPDESLGWRRL